MSPRVGGKCWELDPGCGDSQSVASLWALKLAALSECNWPFHQPKLCKLCYELGIDRLL